MQSKAKTVEQYLASLTADRRTVLSIVRQVILKNLDRDYEEGMQYGMIGYYVPHRVYPAGYHCDPRQPLPFAGLASQKNHMSVYIMSNYGPDHEAFRAAWAKTGKKLDMGKCCIRFKKIEDIPLEVIGDAIRRAPVSAFIDYYERAIRTANKLATAAATRKGAKPRATPSRKSASKMSGAKSGAKKVGAKKVAPKKAVTARKKPARADA